MSAHERQDVAPASRQQRASSFARVADEYERGRPGYPREAIEWLLGYEPLDVLDLGAGTGKLTSALLAAGHRVLAVEPLAEMRAILTSSLPDAQALAGTAEALPLADASVDAVTVGSAFHWFDERLAQSGDRTRPAPAGRARPARQRLRHLLGVGRARARDPRATRDPTPRTLARGRGSARGLRRGRGSRVPARAAHRPRGPARSGEIAQQPRADVRGSPRAGARRPRSAVAAGAGADRAYRGAAAVADARASLPSPGSERHCYSGAPRRAADDDDRHDQWIPAEPVPQRLLPGAVVRTRLRARLRRRRARCGDDHRAALAGAGRRSRSSSTTSPCGAFRPA